MTYCLAIAVEEGLVFASDSRTNAGADHVATYGKLHTFGIPGERQIVVLTAGNLATTQAVMLRTARDIEEGARQNLNTVGSVADAAEYIGALSSKQKKKHGTAVARAGFSAEATYIIGGQVKGRPPRLFMIYPQGNFISSSEQTPFLQIGETKYGKTILDRMIGAGTDLDEAARCALVSMNSTIRSNATVGPPIELLRYDAGSLRLTGYMRLEADDPYLLEVMRCWDKKLRQAFREVPHFDWGPVPTGTRFA